MVKIELFKQCPFFATLTFSTGRATFRGVTTPGYRLKRLREHFGRTQVDVADAANVARSSYVKAEGDAIEWKSAAMRDGLARAYGVPYTAIVGYVLDGTVPFAEMVRLRASHVEQHMARSERTASEKLRLDRIFAAAEKEQKLVHGCRQAATFQIMKEGLLHRTDAQLVAEVLTVNEELGKILKRAFAKRPSSSSHRVR